MPTMELETTESDDQGAGKPEPAAVATNGNGGKRSLLKRVGPPILIVGLIVGFIYYLHGRHYESTDDAFIEGHVIQISPRVAGHIQQVPVDDNQQVKAGDLLVVLDPRDFQARLDQARAALDVAEARVRGAKSSVSVTSATTRAGMTQATSGVEQAQANLAAAQAAVATAQSMVRQAEADVLTEKANTSQAQADVAAAEASETQAQQDLKRYRDLIGEGAVSQQQLDQQATNEKTARARLASAREKVASAQAKVAAAEAKRRAVQNQLLQAETQAKAVQAAIGEATGKLESASSAPHQVAVSRSQEASRQAEYEQSKAQLDAAELDLSYTKIPAPEAGLVTRKSAEPGAYVQVGQALMAIVSKNVWVVANFKETQLTLMRPGQRVTIDVDAYPGVKFRGKVDSIQSGTGARFSLLPPENASGNYVKVVQRVPVKIVFDPPPDPSHLLAPGMSVIPSVKVRP